jgi:hypothetical protein
MLIYSETAFSFINKCEAILKQILELETDFKVRRSRFEYRGYLYPVHLVVFEGDRQLGYFDSGTYQIGLNKALMYHAKDKVLKDILRHELAHYITYLFYGEVKPHGEEFQNVCRLFHWPAAVSAASLDINLANEKLEGDLKAEKVIHKVKSLLKLAESSNQHEAELATLKANQLLLKHNLEYLGQKSDETLYVHKVLIQKRKSAKMTAIYDILKHFMVRPILSYGKKQVALEVTGNRTNIELADYVAGFLNEELERLWKTHQKEHQLKGLRAKNSFFLGLAKGYDSKMQSVHAGYNHKDQKGLILLNRQLDQQVKKIYRRLSSTSNSNSMCGEAFGLGQKAGKDLTINKGIKNSGTTKRIGFQS